MDNTSASDYFVRLENDSIDVRLELERQQVRFQSMFHMSALGMAEIELASGRYINVNDSICEMLGYTRQELLLKSVRQISHPEDQERSDQEYASLVYGEVPVIHMEKRLIRKDGSHLWVFVDAQTIDNGPGRPRTALSIIQDITERKLNEQHLIESERLFRLLADSIPHLASVSLADGTPVWFNERWHAYVGGELKTGDASVWMTLHSPEHVDGVRKKWQDAVHLGVPFEVECPLRGKDGSYRWFLTRVNPVRDANGHVSKWFGTSTDIHDAKQATEALREAKEQAERANQVKSTFLASVTHELRTPLSALLGFADLLKTPDLPLDTQREYLDILNRNGEQLAQIINDLLDLSKIEANQLSFEISPCDPAQIAEEVKTLVSVKAKQKSLGLNLEVDASTPTEIRSDPLRLKQILFNVVGNALKFTPSGCISIFVSSHTEQDRKYIAFKVVDTGIGISPKDGQRIFEMFAQGDESTTRKFGGTGLGLALSRRLAKSLGGDIRLEPTLQDAGSTFVITILDQPHAVQGRDRAACPAAKAQNLRGSRILVVEDAPDIRELFKLFLAREGAQIETAENGQLGLEMALSHHYDVVLMDIQMPVMDGYTATKKLRERNFKPPIIALTAHAMNEIRARCEQAGFTTHISKPVNSRELISTLNRYIPRGHGVPPFQQLHS